MCLCSVLRREFFSKPTRNVRDARNPHAPRSHLSFLLLSYVRGPERWLILHLSNFGGLADVGGGLDLLAPFNLIQSQPP
jgi:hypothetical protein